MSVTTGQAIECFHFRLKLCADSYNHAVARGYLKAATSHKRDMEIHQIAIAALQEKAERENPQPLTLEELGKMEDEPVWVQSPGVPEYGRWAIVAGVDTTDGDKTLYLHNDFTCHEYGRVWIAYRHKPKEANNEA